MITIFTNLQVVIIKISNLKIMIGRDIIRNFIYIKIYLELKMPNILQYYNSLQVIQNYLKIKKQIWLPKIVHKKKRNKQTIRVFLHILNLNYKKLGL